MKSRKPEIQQEKKERNFQKDGQKEVPKDSFRAA